MAEAIVNVLVEQLLSIGRQRIEQEVKLLVGVEDEVKSLTRTLNFIKASLNDAEKRQATEERIQVWLENLKDIMYDAEDVLEEWFTRISISQSKNQGVVTDDNSIVCGKVRSYLFSLCSCFQPVSIVHKHEIASAIEKIRENLDVIAREKDQLKLMENDSHQQEYSSPRITSSIVDVSEICGRDLDKEVLLRRLVGECSTQQADIPIIAIVGMGGSGKTTLAQLIYSEIKSNFEICMWVCVSDPFDLHKVTKEIIEQTPGGKGKYFVGWESLHQCLSEAVKGKKYLLVLDDVWSEDGEVWDPLKFSLKGGAQGSRIIVTTRNEGVAKMMGSDIHTLGMLSEEDSWLLFWRIASLGKRQEELQKLEVIGNEIAKKCKGLPLAVKTIASLMRSQRNEHDWKSVLASNIWDIQLVEKSILPALWLSYYALPPHLKQCFTYCAVFPKDTVMYKDALVKHWMAQGFLGYDGSKELEMDGVNYFEDLVSRSFFQDIERGNYSYVQCKMHDLVHDLALFLSGKEFRHIGAREKEDEFPSESKNLRSLRIKPNKQAFLKICSELRHLRLLDLSDSGIAEVPNEVGGLLHLRYLDLSWNIELKELPETMCDLYHLQTLKLTWCRSLCKLPEGIGKLSNLRHIEVRDTRSLKAYPRGIGRLHQLRELCKFPVSAASEGCCGLEELGNLNHLEGYLEITGLGNVKSVDEAKRAELQKKKKLVALKLEFGYEKDEMDIKQMEAVLEGLQPAESLKYLTIKDFPGVKLRLQKCKNCIELPALGSLRSLELLYVEGLEAVRHIGSEFYGVGTEISFPKLRELELRNMPELGDWEIPYSYCKQVMPRLFKLGITNCPKLRALPEGLGKLESLEKLILKDVGIDVFVAGGNGESSSSSSVVLFPKLRILELKKMPEWEETSVVISATNSIIMPNLQELSTLECGKLKAVPHYMFSPSLKSLYLGYCPQLTDMGMRVPGLQGCEHLLKLEIISCRKLRALPEDLGKLESLEELILEDVGIDVFAAGGNGESSSSSSVVLFPKLRILRLRNLPEWEETSVVISATNSIIMPNLQNLIIGECGKLKAVPHYMFSPSLKTLDLGDCPQLTDMGMQPNKPSLQLEKLALWGDVGMFSKSLLSVVLINTDNNTSSNYSNLKRVEIWRSPHSCLPQGLNRFTSLEYLIIWHCEFLDLKPEEELRHFPMLKELNIYNCPVVEERCKREDWSTSCPYRITINFREYNEGRLGK